MEGLQLFELAEDLSPMGVANAWLLKWNGTSYVRTTKKIELYEFVKQYGHKGDRGYAFFSQESNRWEAMSGLFEQDSFDL